MRRSSFVVGLAGFTARLVLAVAMTTSATASGCSQEGEREPNAAPRYGYAPSADGPTVYQPDVVLLTTGSDAIRSVSPNGLTYTLDAAAPGVDKLEVGKVVFATSQCAGRIVQISRAGGPDVTVTLAPVELTEIVKDGDIRVEQDVHVEQMGMQTIPDLPGAESTPEADPGATTTKTVIAPTLQLSTTRDATLPGPEVSGQVTKKLNDWDVTAYKSANRIGLRGERGMAERVDGLKVSVDFHLDVANLHVVGHVPVHGGQVGAATFRVDGITAIGLDLKAGTEEGISSNRKVRMVIPIELNEPIIVAGFPMTLSQKFQFIAESAFSAKNSTLKASGLWGLDGPIGIASGNLLVPTFSVQKSLVDSIDGVSVGANGFVAAASFRFGLGVGLPVGSAGPYAAATVSAGVTNGSALGIVRCRRADLIITAKAGVGISMPSPVKAAVEKILGKEIPGEKEVVSQDIVRKTATVPDVKACTE